MYVRENFNGQMGLYFDTENNSPVGFAVLGITCGKFIDYNLYMKQK